MHRVLCRGPDGDDCSVNWTNADALELGKRLRDLRKQKGLTQEGLAYSAGLTKNSLQLLEAGRGSGRKDSTSPSNPRMATMTTLAGALDMSVSELLAEAGL